MQNQLLVTVTRVSVCSFFGGELVKNCLIKKYSFSAALGYFSVKLCKEWHVEVAQCPYLILVIREHVDLKVSTVLNVFLGPCMYFCPYV